MLADTLCARDAASEAASESDALRDWDAASCEADCEASADSSCDRASDAEAEADASSEMEALAEAETLAETSWSATSLVTEARRLVEIDSLWERAASSPDAVARSSSDVTLSLPEAEPSSAADAVWPAEVWSTSDTAGASDALGERAVTSAAGAAESVTSIDRLSLLATASSCLETDCAPYASGWTSVASTAGPSDCGASRDSSEGATDSEGACVADAALSRSVSMPSVLVESSSDA